MALVIFYAFTTIEIYAVQQKMGWQRKSSAVVRWTNYTAPTPLHTRPSQPKSSMIVHSQLHWTPLKRRDSKLETQLRTKLFTEAAFLATRTWPIMHRPTKRPNRGSMCKIGPHMSVEKCTSTDKEFFSILTAQAQLGPDPRN